MLDMGFAMTLFVGHSVYKVQSKIICPTNGQNKEHS
jgi:hypothetical protein